MAEQNPPSQPPPPHHQPDPKRLKMSSTTTTSDDETPRTPKYKRRKIAIFFAYLGVGYQGMQKNPGAKTIEADLEEALYLSGAVPEPDRGQPKRFEWARSARTDKGVSAVGQVVSGRFYVDPPGFVDRLNSSLSPQIRVFGYRRVIPSFSSKKFCDRRRYVYLVPVFALDPTCHRDRESVLASVGSGRELVKCLECSERGRKVVGVMGKRSYERVDVGSGISSNTLSAGKIEAVDDERIVSVENDGVVGDAAYDNGKSETAENEDTADEKEVVSVDVGSGISSNASSADKIEAVNDEKIVSVENNGVVGDVDCDNAKSESGPADEKDGVSVDASSETGKLLENGGENDEIIKDDKMECENANGQVDLEQKSEFRYGEEEKERFNRILKYYVGTHNFHNFTTRTKAEDPAAKRYIMSFTANTVLNINGIDFVKCEVVGQSFMLHQIRKMIGLAVAIMRNCAPESLIETAFQQKVNINVPMAPEVGLYLDECFFPSYNQKWKDTHEELSMKDYAQEAEEFKLKYIYSHIASSEHKDGSMAIWLHSLNYRNYPDLRFSENAPIGNGRGDEAIDNSGDGRVDEAVDNRPISDGRGDEAVDNRPISDVCE